MVKDLEVLNEIKGIRKKTGLLADPWYNDGAGSDFWGDVDKQLGKIENDIEENLKSWSVL